MHIHNLFPTPVGLFKLGRNLTEEESQFICFAERRPNDGNTTSADRAILRHKETTELRNFIEQSLVEYFKTVYKHADDVSIYITQSWVNFTEQNQYHHKHAHPNSFISGVFYPQTNRATDRIYFYKDGYERIKVSATEWNEWNSDSWWFDVGSGDLILFPSNLTHMVPVKKEEGTRISISFNTFLKGTLGDDLALTELRL